jgi:hypothetical protein
MIEEAIEAEINARVNEKIESMLAIISKTYHIKIERLMSDISITTVPKNTTCHGVLKTGSKCKCKPKDGTNYCKRHENQKPKVIKKVEDAGSSVSNPFFMGLQLRKTDAASQDE